MAHYVWILYGDFVHKVHSQSKGSLNNLKHFLKLWQIPLGSLPLSLFTSAVCLGAWSCRLKTRKVDVLPGPTTCCFWMLTLSSKGKSRSLLPLPAVHFRWHRFLLAFLGWEWKVFGCCVGISFTQKKVSCLPFCSVTSLLPLASVPPRPADKQHMSLKIPLLKETRAALPLLPRSP